MSIIAIDPSLTNTAVVVGDVSDYRLKTFSSGNIGNDVAGRIARYDALVASIMEWIGEPDADAIYIEGYSFGSKGGALSSICEYGGILRWHLDELSDRIFEVAPSTLKKFCTGKGDGNKDMVAAHLSRRWNVMFHDNDSFDAFGLYRLGLVAEGLAEPDNQAQREAANKVLGIATPKKKRITQLSAQ